MMPTEQVKENPKNRNIHAQDQIDRLAKLITKYGFRHPVIISKATDQVVAGHGRLYAARKIGLKEIPVQYQDFENAEEEYGFGISDNAIARWADLDFGGINLDLPDLGPDFNIDHLGIKDFVLEPADKLKVPKKALDEDIKKENLCPSCGHEW